MNFLTMTVQRKWSLFCSILLFSNSIISTLCECDNSFYLIRSKSSNLVLDANSRIVTLQHFDGYTPQLWQFKTASRPGLFHIINYNFGYKKLLDVDRSSGQTVIVAPEDESLFQQWFLHSNGRIINAGSKKVLDITGGRFEAGNNLQVWVDNGSISQDFIIKEKRTCCPSTSKNLARSNNPE